jgi:hypothetical protein
MSKPLVLYSTNTWLAYKIAEVYYNQVHYVWCASTFIEDSVPAHDYTLPPSSSPGKIYNDLLEDVQRTDHHSAKIAANKIGLLRGANLKVQERVITRKQKSDTYAIVDQAQLRDFRPLVYVIPWQAVRNLVQEVPVRERAHPLSNEYLVERLPRRCFDIIEFMRKV